MHLLLVLLLGGLSCLAVQGGLLTSSLAYQIERDLDSKTTTEQTYTKRIAVAKPILFFLLAKLLAYTTLGFLLGWLGSMLQLTPISRALLQIGIGIFIGLTALRLLTNHPWLRFFTFEPPRPITKAIRKISKGDYGWITPLLLGLMTVLIPCGVTQAMMAVAMGSGDPILGAGIMLAFTLGTSPVFFSIAYFATKLGSRLEKAFSRFVAVVMLVLGITTIVGGANILGLPILLNEALPISNTGASIGPALAKREPISPTAAVLQAGFGCPCCKNRFSSSKPNPPLYGPTLPTNTPLPPSESMSKLTSVITLYAKNDGYEPRELIAPANQQVTLNIITQDTYSCSLAFVIPSLNVQLILPPSGTTSLDIPPQKPGTVIPFSCSMGMYTGKITFK